MPSWLDNKDTYEVSRDGFPAHLSAYISHAHQLHGPYEIRITQIRYFKGNTQYTGYPDTYYINGETAIEDHTVIVSCGKCTRDQFNHYKQHPDEMVFTLMGGERIPESWI